MNTYFIRQEAIFVDGADDKFVEESIISSGYNILGGICEISLVTERYLHTIWHEWMKSQRMLNRSGKMGGTVSDKEAMSTESWRYLTHSLSKLCEELSPISANKFTKQSMLRSNLSMKSEWLPTTYLQLKANTGEKFAACRSLFSATYGIGLRKAFPSKSTVGTQLNPVDISACDTVNIVDIDLYDADAHNNWFDDDAYRVEHYTSQPQRNFVKWVYDKRLGQCRTVIKCSALISGACDAQPLVDLLNVNALDWGDDDNCMLYEGASVMLDGIVYTVEHVDVNDEVVLINEETNELRRAMFDLCVDNLL